MSIFKALTDKSQSDFLVEVAKKTPEIPWAKTTKSQRSHVAVAAPIIHDDEHSRVHRLDTHQAHKILAGNSSWCTNQKDSYDQYTDYGHLYLIYDKKHTNRYLYYQNPEDDDHEPHLASQDSDVKDEKNTDVSSLPDHLHSALGAAWKDRTPLIEPEDREKIGN